MSQKFTVNTVTKSLPPIKKEITVSGPAITTQALAEAHVARTSPMLNVMPTPPAPPAP